MFCCTLGAIWWSNEISLVYFSFFSLFFHIFSLYSDVHPSTGEMCFYFSNCCWVFSFLSFFGKISLFLFLSLCSSVFIWFYSQILRCLPQKNTALSPISHTKYCYSSVLFRSFVKDGRFHVNSVSVCCLLCLSFFLSVVYFVTCICNRTIRFGQPLRKRYLFSCSQNLLH